MRSWWLALNIGILAASLGCTEQGKPFSPNEPAKRQAAAPPVSIADTPESAKASSEAPKWQDQFNSAKDPLLEVLVPLSKRVLDPKRVMATKSMIAQSVEDELIVFNHLVLQTSAKDQARPEFIQILKQFEVVLATDCGAFLDSCTGYRYLKRSSNSSQVFKLVALNDPPNYFRMLTTAVQLKNKEWDGDLIAMLYRQPMQSISQSELKYRDTVRAMLGTALQMARDKNLNAVQARAFLDSIHAWNLAGQDIQSFDGSTQDTLYTMIAQAHYMYADKGGGLHPEFKKILTTRERDTTGFAGRQQQLKTQNLFNPELIGAKYIGQFDELYFIIDSVFTKQISPESGANLFGGTGKSMADLKIAVENYMRIEFLFSLYDSTLLAQKIFKANVQASDLLSNSILQSSSVKQIWSNFTSEAMPLRNFTVLAAGQRATDNAASDALRSLFDSIPKSINFASAYPHELALFHLLSQQHVNVRLPDMGPSDSGNLLNLLFTGQIPLLFQYSNDVSRLNQFQLLYAFDMAVRTNLFQILGIDVDYFISDTLNRINAGPTRTINSGLNNIQARFSQTSTYPEFLKVCSELKGASVHREFYFGEVTTSPNYGNLMNFVFQDIGATGKVITGSVDKSPMGIFYLDQDFAETVENARLDLGSALQMANAMLISYKSTLAAQGLTPDQIAKKTPLTLKLISDLQQTRLTVLQTAKQWYNDLGWCYWKADNQDRVVRIQALEMEKAYLRQVHRDMQKLRANPNDVLLARAMQGKIEFPGLPSGFRGLDRISGNEYRYSSVDLLLRIAKYMTKGLTTDEGIRPPLNRNITINYGDALNADVDLVRDAVQQSLMYVDSQDEFVNSGLRAIFFPKPNYLNWNTTPEGHIASWEHSLTSLFALYRLEHEVRGTNTDFTPKAILDMHTDILSLTKLEPEERDIFEAIHVYSKFDPTYLDLRLIVYDIDNKKITDTWGLYDFPIRLSNQEQYGFHLDQAEATDTEGRTKEINLRAPLTTGGQAYYHARSITNRGSSVVPFNSQVDQVLDASVKTFVQSELSAINDFHAATVAYVNAIPADASPEADVNLSRKITLLLTTSLIPSYDASIAQFNQSTQQCFVGVQTCQEFR